MLMPSSLGSLFATLAVSSAVLDFRIRRLLCLFAFLACSDFLSHAQGVGEPYTDYGLTAPVEWKPSRRS